MPITSETLRLVERMRRAVGSILDRVTRSLVEAWVRAWDQMAVEVAVGIGEVLAAGDGQWPPRRTIERTARMMSALDTIAAALTRLEQLTRSQTAAGAAEAARVAFDGQSELIASQLPHGSTQASAARYRQQQPDTIDAIVRRTAEQIHAAHWPLAEEATAAMKRELVRGVVVGDNPRTAAARMLKGLEGEFNGGLTRALVLSRTEIIDAHRQAAEIAQADHADVLDGWVWHAELNKDRGRTCPSCWAKHGTLHPLSEPGPLDHQSGRCSRLPKAKSWAALGFTGLDEPEDQIPTGQQVFAGLPADEQAAIMGRRRRELLQTGQIDWADLSQLRTTPGWRESYGVRPVKDLERLATDPDAADQDPTMRQLITGTGGPDVSAAAMRRAANAIDQVHIMPPGMPVIPLTANYGKNLGVYHRDKPTDAPVGISIAPNGPYPSLTSVHELGHFLDHAGFPPGQGFSVQRQLKPGDLFSDWWDVVFYSHPIQTLLDIKDALRHGDTLVQRVRPDGSINDVDVDHKYIDYLTHPREAFGRSYAQWIAVRSGDPQLLADLRLAQDHTNGELPLPGSGIYAGYPRHWDDKGFEPIALALDEVFRRLGLLR
ncbi:hypothetical protein GCM10017673_56560 [Streptosporangium violaceochromogenes]|nr:hypothetical protein GCM10017673_56560 [Streptosporangium violaceochromogenes]